MSKLTEILDQHFTGEQHDELHGTFLRIPFTKQMEKAEQAILDWVAEVIDTPVKIGVSDFHPTEEEVRAVVDKLRAEQRKRAGL